MIEGRWIPRAGVVAGLTSGRESGLRVGRVVRFVEVRQVTADAGGRRPHEFAACVAGVAVQGSVRSGQCEPSELQMVEPRTHPVVHRVTLLAGRRKIQRDVIDPEGFRIHEILLMAGVAHRRKTLELPDRRAFVTGIAIHRGVSADQREAIQMLVDLLDRNMPPLYGMALLAIGAHLAFVDIGMAIGALRAYVGKDRFGVALGTSHSLVHAPQRILGGVVVKLRHRADGLPTA